MVEAIGDGRVEVERALQNRKMIALFQSWWRRTTTGCAYLGCANNYRYLAITGVLPGAVSEDLRTGRYLLISSRKEYIKANSRRGEVPGEPNTDTALLSTAHIIIHMKQ